VTTYVRSAAQVQPAGIRLQEEIRQHEAKN
jgi:hypothetical protein